MRAGNRLPTLLLFTLLLPAGPLSAASPKSVIEELAYRGRTILPTAWLLGPEVTPQAVPAADPQGPTVSVAQLDNPAQLERDLRAALRHPLSDTRLTVTGGSARLGALFRRLGGAHQRRTWWCSRGTPRCTAASKATWSRSTAT